jgi:hypothetical protein
MSRMDRMKSTGEFNLMLLGNGLLKKSKVNLTCSTP